MTIHDDMIRRKTIERLAWEIAVDMEIHASIRSTTKEKAAEIEKSLVAACVDTVDPLTIARRVLAQTIGERDAARAENERLRSALIRERQRRWRPEYPGQAKPELAVWFTREPEAGLSGFDHTDDRDAFQRGGEGPFLRRVTGNENPQMPFRLTRATTQDASHE